MPTKSPSPLDWRGEHTTVLLGVLVTVATIAQAFREKFHRSLTGRPEWISGDLTVYQDGAIAVLHHIPLVGDGFVSRTGLPFTYPPFSALVFTPLGFIDTTAAAMVWTAMLLGCAALTIWALARLEGLRPPWVVVGTVLGLTLLTLPLYRNLHYGQINLVLMALVVLDLTVVPPRFRGVLTGLAAGLKITPLAFVVFFVFRKNWAAVATAIVTFLATIGIGWIALPEASRRFWTSEAWDTTRAGALNFGDNESITGALGRMGMSTESVQSVFPWLSIPLIALTLWVTWGLWRRDRRVAALGLFSAGLVMCEPIGWLHHAALAPLSLVVCLLSPRYRSWVRWAAGAFVVLAIGAPLWWDQLDAPMGTAYPVWRQLAYSSPLLAGLTLLVAAAVWLRRVGPGSAVSAEAASCTTR